MKMKTKMKTKKVASIVGRTVQVDICPHDAGFVLSVGPVSIWLPPNAARDVVATLGRALLVETLGVRQPTPAAAPPPRVASN
jgi:hypothetical protein